MIKRKYTPGEPLTETEFLFKLRPAGYYRSETYPTGFLTKLTKKGELPKAFEDWGYDYNKKQPAEIHVFEEDYRSGWKILDLRYGTSQSWIVVLHPEGFTLEVSLPRFLELIKEGTPVLDSYFIEELRWSQHSLIKRPITN